MKFFFITFSIFLLSASSAFAQAINSISDTKTLGMELLFQGTTGNHSFRLLWDECEVVDNQQQIAARLVDEQGDDVGTNDITQYVEFSLADMSCRPAELTVRIGRRAHATIYLEN
jgi:hypothetical protein